MDRFKTVESFVAVAKCGSYSRAAKQFGVSRAIMSRRIIELETRLGVRLFNRNTHQLSLTEAGRSYLANCESVLSDLESAELSLIEGRKVARGSLRVLTSQSFGTIQLGAATADFMQHYPAIDVYVMTSSLPNQAMELVGGGFDLALRTNPLADSTLIARKITPLDWYVVAAPAYLAQHGTPQVPRDLAQHRCLVTGIEPSHQWRLESAAGSETVKVAGFPVSNLTTITHDAARAGLGVALLPDYCVAQDLQDGRLVRLLPAWRGKQRWLYAIYLKERSLPLKTRLFIDFLSERFGACSWSARSSPARGSWADAPLPDRRATLQP